MKPFFSFYGGKQRLATRIVEQITAIPHSVYVEPLAGGAAVLFAKPKVKVSNNDDYREVINDTDERLITLYRVLQDPQKCTEFLHRIDFTPYSREEYLRSCEILKSDGYTDIERAWAYYVNISMSFSKKLFGGFGIGISSQNVADTFATKKSRLHYQIKRFDSVHIECLDAIECIQKWDSKNTLFYCDPPYPGTEMGHYKGYTTKRWKALCAALDEAKGSYILSNYDQTIEPKTAQQKIPISAYSSAARTANKENGARTEILWICDRSESGYGQIDLFRNAG